MKRNGKIEILRFVFCIVVILYHINLDVWKGEMGMGKYLSFFIHGRTCVEFFFLLSGFLMAKSVHRNPKPDAVSVGADTVSYLYKKIKGVWIPYLILSVAMIIYIPFAFKNPVGYIVDRMPSMFFLQRTGIADEGFITVSWYLSSLFLAIAVIYPFLRKYYDYTSLVVAPVISSLAIGALIHETGHLPQRAFGGVIHLSSVRAVAVVLLGVFTYRVCLYLSELNLSKAGRVVLFLTENICWLISLYYLISIHSEKYEGHITYLMAAAIAISFAVGHDTSIYNNRLVYFLGRISLPVYLAQGLVRTVVKQELSHLNGWVRAALILSFTLVLGIILDRVVMIIKTKNKTVK